MLPEFGKALKIGATFEVTDAYVMAILICKCLPTNKPIFLRGTDLRVICKECGDAFQITKVDYNLSPRLMPTVIVEMVGKMPPEQLAVLKAQQKFSTQ